MGMRHGWSRFRLVPRDGFSTNRLDYSRYSNTVYVICFVERLTLSPITYQSTFHAPKLHTFF